MTHTHERRRASDQQQGRDVRVCSQYSLQECQRYALHLQKTGQGITNPGGYATTIHRSGEADALIAQFIDPQQDTEQQLKHTDLSACPDCHGTMYWYPQGAAKGVARCPHTNIARGATAEPPAAHGRDDKRSLTAPHNAAQDAA